MQYEHYRDGKEYFNIGKCISHGHFHRAIELVYCLQEPKPVVIDDKKMTVDAGKLLFVPPFATHVFTATDTHRSLCVVLPAACTDMFEKQTDGKMFENLVFTDTAIARNVYEHLLLLRSTRNPLLRDGIYRYVLGTLIENGTLVENVRKQEADFAIRVLTYLEKNYTEKLTLETVSAALGYNRCYFSTVFKKTFMQAFAITLPCSALTSLCTCSKVNRSAKSPMRSDSAACRAIIPISSGSWDSPRRIPCEKPYIKEPSSTSNRAWFFCEEENKGLAQKGKCKIVLAFSSGEGEDIATYGRIGG